MVYEEDIHSVTHHSFCGGSLNGGHAEAVEDLHQ